MNVNCTNSPACLREGQCVEVDGQVYQVVDVDEVRGEYLVNVADGRGESLMVGQLRIAFAHLDGARP